MTGSVSSCLLTWFRFRTLYSLVWMKSLSTRDDIHSWSVVSGSGVSPPQRRRHSFFSRMTSKGVTHMNPSSQQDLTGIKGLFTKLRSLEYHQIDDLYWQLPAGDPLKLLLKQLRPIVRRPGSVDEMVDQEIRRQVPSDEVAD